MEKLLFTAETIKKWIGATDTEQGIKLILDVIQTHVKERHWILANSKPLEFNRIATELNEAMSQRLIIIKQNAASTEIKTS